LNNTYQNTSSLPRSRSIQGFRPERPNTAYRPSYSSFNSLILSCNFFNSSLETAFLLSSINLFAQNLRKYFGESNARSSFSFRNSSTLSCHSFLNPCRTYSAIVTTCENYLPCLKSQNLLDHNIDNIYKIC